MERSAILWAIEVLTKNEELAIKHLPPALLDAHHWPGAL